MEITEEHGKSRKGFGLGYLKIPACGLSGKFTIGQWEALCEKERVSQRKVANTLTPRRLSPPNSRLL